jgi:hypothetical protein
MATSANVVFILDKPLKISTGDYDVIYATPISSITSLIPLSHIFDYNSMVVIGDISAGIYVTTPKDNVIAMIYDDSDGVALAGAIALFQRFGFLDLT